MQPQPLATYRAKRRFGVTAEPRGRARLKKGGNSFVVQQHDATRMHYDFRLEIDGVMVSWAVPKGPSLDPADKRLAVQTEDHPVEYNDFEGSIPHGEYGGGPVIIWDRGQWTPEGDPAAALRKGHLSFSLDGEKLQGRYTLVRSGRGPNKTGPKSSWLLFKRSDEHARSGAEAAVTEREPLSVVSGRTVQQVGQGVAAAWPQKKSAGKKAAAGAFPPRDLGVQLATLTDTPPGGDGWAYEIKFDGYRMLAVVDGARVQLQSRNDLDWTGSFSRITEALKKLKRRRTVLDGEVCYITEDGRSSFQHLQNSLERGRPGAGGSNQRRLFYYVFDLLIDEGEDLRGQAFHQRKQRLQALLGKRPPQGLVYSQHVQGNGRLSLNQACAAGLEGLIAKRLDAPYQSGRGRDWLKLKCHQRQEFIIVGYSSPEGSRQGFGALLLALRQGEELVYKGKVGTGFSADSLRELARRLGKLAVKESALAEAPRMRNVTWVRPELICEVEYTEITSEGLLRHPSFQGLRQDKRSAEVVEEKPAAAPKKPAARKAGKEGRLDVGGVSISHPERILDQASGLTKGELAEYHRAMSAWTLPYAKNRPIAVVRCPQGDAQECFFQKQKTPGLGGEVHTTHLAGHEVIYVEKAAGLLELVQFNVIEFHGWGATVRQAGKPDWIVMDLDPDVGLAFSKVVDSALELREIFKGAGLQSWVKTTGGKGLHVVIPLTPRAHWPEVKAFAHGIANALAQQWPRRYVATLSKAQRKGKIFVDYLRNGEGATAVLPYSPRARPGAPVAMPVDWKDLNKLDPREFTVRSALHWVKKRKADPWAGLRDCQQLMPSSH